MGMPKALLRRHPGGPTFVEEALRGLLAGGCDGATVVVGAAADDVRESLHRRRLAEAPDVVECSNWREGMGASLRAGLAAVAAGAALAPRPVLAVVVTLVDLPDVGAPVVHRLLTAAHRAGPWPTVLARAAYDGVPGHPALLGREHWAAVSATATGDRGAREHFAATAHLLVEMADLATGRDVDSPTDLPDPR